MACHGRTDRATVQYIAHFSRRHRRFRRRAVETSTPALPGIDRANLVPLVRQALGEPRIDRVEFSVTLIHGGYAAVVSGGGVFRVAGTAWIGERSTPWSLVLKIVRASAAVAADEALRRESLAYNSDLLTNLPGGITAPRCYAAGIGEDGAMRLWLEDLDDAKPGSEWDLADYAVAARHLGAFNGAYLSSRPVPAAPWLSRDWLRGYLASNGEHLTRLREAISAGGTVCPLPADLIDDLSRLWDDGEALLNALDRLPRSFGHFDAFSRNLFRRRGPDGGDQIVAIDWSYSGLAALGEDLAPFVCSSAIFEMMEPTDVEELDRVAFAGYVEGLRQAGWSGDARLARLGFAAAAALRYGPEALWVYLPMTESARELLVRMFRVPPDQVIAATIPWRRFVLRLGDEARELIDARGLG